MSYSIRMVCHFGRKTMMYQSLTLLTISYCLRGGSKQFFGRSHFEHRALGAPSHIGETFGEDSGPRRPTCSEPRPAQLLRPKYACLPVDRRGSNGPPNCSSNHPNLPHIGFDGSRTNGIAVASA